MLSLHKNKKTTLGVAMLMVPALAFAINTLIKTNNTFALDYDIPDNYTTITDPNFYDCVATEFVKEFPSETIPVTGLTDEQLGKITVLPCGGEMKQDEDKITNTKGLEKMTSLTILDVISNKLTSLDVSENIALTEIDAGYNQIATIDVSGATSLTDLWLNNNQITSLNISNNKSLTYLDVGSNQLEFLDISNNKRLSTLYLDNILLYTGMIPVVENSNYIYDISELGFILDNYIPPKSPIYSTDNYTYNRGNSTLVVNNPVGAGKYIQVYYPSGTGYFKLALPNILEFDTNDTGSLEPMFCYADPVTNECTVTIPDTIPTREGYEFFGYTLDNTKDTPDYLPGGTYTFTNGEYNTTLYAIWADGNINWQQGQIYTKGDNTNAVLKVNYPYGSLSTIKIDNIELTDTTKYKVESGSTILTLYSAYLDTLEDGTHTLELAYNNAIARTTFTIKSQNNNDNDSTDKKGSAIKTPDTGNITKSEGSSVAFTGLSIFIIVSSVVVYINIREKNCQNT